FHLCLGPAGGDVSAGRHHEPQPASTASPFAEGLPMPVLCTCPRGPHWEQAANAPSSDAGQPAVCPICGTSVGAGGAEAAAAAGQTTTPSCLAEVAPGVAEPSPLPPGRSAAEDPNATRS